MARRKNRGTPDRVAVAVYLTKEIAEKLKKRAEDERRSVSMQAFVFIENGLK